MKKNVFLMLALGVLFTSCKKDEPVIDYGTMTLSPKTATIKYGESVTIIPTLSETGLVNEQSFNWSVSDQNVLKFEASTIGSNGIATGNRIGTSDVMYISQNGRYKDTVQVTVAPRQLFRKVFFTKGATLENIYNEEGKLSADSVNSNNTIYFFNRDVSSTQVFKKVAYQFESNSLIATYAILDDNATNQTVVSQYVDERFRSLNDNTGVMSKKSVTFFNAAAQPVNMYETGTVIGVFQQNSNLITGSTLPLGIVIADSSKI